MLDWSADGPEIESESSRSNYVVKMSDIIKFE